MKNLDSTKKSRYFAFVVYADNQLLKDDDLEPREVLVKKLRSTFGDYAVSPLHQPDGEEKQEHYHVVYYHGNTVSLKSVRDMFQRYNTQYFEGLSTVQLIHNNFIVPLHHPRNYQRYLLHLDQPEKQQFEFENEEDLITVVNNFPLDLTRELSKADKMRLQREIEVFIKQYSLLEYFQIVDYLRNSQELTDHYDYLTSHTLHFSRYLDSIRNYEIMKKADAK